MESLKAKHLLFAAGLNAGLLWGAYIFVEETIDLLNKNIVLLLLYTGFIFVFIKKRSVKIGGSFTKVGFSLLLLLDLGMNSGTIFKNYIEATYHPNNWYDVHNPSYKQAINFLKQSDSSFYRTKVDRELETSLNESLRYKYKGMSIYTSTGNAEHNLFLGKLGYLTNTREVHMENGFFLSDALLGFKYFVTKNELDERIYTKVLEDGEIKVYQMKLNLPLGYLTDENFMEIGNEQDVFTVQNRLLRGEYYEKLQPELNGTDLEQVTNHVGEVIFHRKPEAATPTLEATINISDMKLLYMQLDENTYPYNADKLDLLINGQPIKRMNTGLHQLIDLGAYEDETITVTIKFINDTQSLPLPAFYTLDYTKLEAAVNELKSRPFRVYDHGDTYVSGEVTVDEENVLFLSIFYDENWQITVDGKTVEPIKLGSFIGIPLTQGTHTIRLAYQPKVLYLMAGVSGISLAAYLMIQVANRARRRKTSGKEPK